MCLRNYILILDLFENINKENLDAGLLCSFVYDEIQL